jgi:tetratricopeptide (TPR) repeat protein
MGRVAETLGQYDEAIVRYNQALTIDPLSARTLSFLAAALADKGLLDQSEVILRKILKLYPAGPFGVHLDFFPILLARGEPKAALEALEAEPDEIARNERLPIAYWALGRRAESDSALHTLEANHANDLPFSIAVNHAYRGELDDAFLWLTKAYQQRDSSLVSIKISHSLRALHGVARYKTLLRKMNLPE